MDRSAKTRISSQTDGGRLGQGDSRMREPQKTVIGTTSINCTIIKSVW